MSDKLVRGSTSKWTYAIAATVLLHVVLYWLVGLAGKGRSSDSKSRKQFASITYLGPEEAVESASLAQQISLGDPRPLLLPTEWNTSNVLRLREFTQEESGLFSAYEPLFELEEGDYLDDFGTVPASYDTLSRAQSEFDKPPFQGLRSREHELPLSSNEGVELVLRNPVTGERIKRVDLGSNLRDRVSGRWPNWEPAVLLGVVSETYLLGQFTVVKSSGYIDVDGAIVEEVRRVTSQLAGLSDGAYLLEINP